MNYKGTIIEESLQDVSALKKMSILSTKIEKVTEKHKSPWLKQWTLYTIEIPEDKAEEITSELSESLESEHEWYADFKNDTHHYIIFRGKVFKVDRSKPREYEKVRRYGMKLGIPAYQLDFSPEIQ